MKKLSVFVVVGLLFIFARGLAQDVHFNNLQTIDPYIVGLPATDFFDTNSLQNSPEMTFNVLWDANGGAHMYDGTQGGGFTRNVNVSVGIGANATYSYTYRVDVLNLGNGTAVIVVNWTRQDMGGHLTNGQIPVWQIKKEYPNLRTAPPSPNNDNGAPVDSRQKEFHFTLGSYGSAGYWVTTSFTYTYGYMGDNGTYYCIEATANVTLWMQDFGGAGGNQMDT